MLSYAIPIPDGDILNYYNVDQTCRQELLVFNNTDIHMVNFIEILIKYTIVLNFPDLIENKSDFLLSVSVHNSFSDHTAQNLPRVHFWLLNSWHHKKNAWTKQTHGRLFCDALSPQPESTCVKIPWRHCCSALFSITWWFHSIFWILYLLQYFDNHKVSLPIFTCLQQRK